MLGALLIDNEKLPTAMGHGGTDLFYDPVHEWLFLLIAEKVKRGELASPVSLAELVRHNEGFNQLGGPPYLARLAGASISSFAFEDYCDLLADLHAKRAIAQALDRAQDDITTGVDSCDIVVARMEASIAAVNVQGQAKTVSMMKATTLALEQADAAWRGELKGMVPTGIESLDDYVTGFRSGELILLGGRPSMGKTSVALNIALNVARTGKPVIICSLEMNPEAMAVRAISEQSAQDCNAVSYRDIIGGNVADWQMGNVVEAAKKVAELPIQFLTREFSDLGSMKAGVVQAKKALGGKPALMVIDYAQLLKTPAKSRYEQITEISIYLKAMAGQMGFPILALSQLSRSLEQREDKRPMLSDLRESGQLEQDADTVLFCYRDEYYIERERPDEENHREVEAYNAALDASRNKLEIIVAKQRQGPIGTAHVKCNVSLNRIWEGQ